MDRVELICYYSAYKEGAVIKNKKGFTLGETIIIVVIIIVLALILIWGVWTFIKFMDADVDLSGSSDLCTGIVLDQP